MYGMWGSEAYKFDTPLIELFPRLGWKSFMNYCSMLTVDVHASRNPHNYALQSNKLHRFKSWPFYWLPHPSIAPCPCIRWLCTDHPAAVAPPLPANIDPSKALLSNSHSLHEKFPPSPTHHTSLNPLLHNIPHHNGCQQDHHQRGQRSLPQQGRPRHHGVHRLVANSWPARREGQAVRLDHWPWTVPDGNRHWACHQR